MIAPAKLKIDTLTSDLRGQQDKRGRGDHGTLSLTSSLSSDSPLNTMQRIPSFLETLPQVPKSWL